MRPASPAARAAGPALLAAALVLAGATPVRADGTVTIDLTPEGEQLASDLGLDPAELATELEQELGDLYDAYDVEDYLRAFANATSFANRGIGVDYAPTFRGGEIGLTVNLAAAVEGLDEGEDPATGIAPNLALMGGLNLSRWGHPELAIYGHGMYRSAGLDELSGSITNVGAHVQYHLFFPSRQASSILFLWSGLHLTAGIEYSRWAFSLERSLTHDFGVTGDTASTTITADASGTFDLASSSLTIPIELTTSGRLAYFLGIYGGVGVDIQTGSSRADAILAANLDGVDPTTGDPVDVGTATVTIDGENGPATLAYHILFGLEANLGRLKLFGQATLVPVDGASVAFGLRFKI